MKKKIDTQALVDELQQSAFFRRPTPPSTPTPTQASEQPGGFPNTATPTPPAAEDTRTPRTGSTPPTPLRRQMIRHPFEVYSDQVEKLREFALEDRRNGGTGSMSKMVRDAIDRVITERSGGKRKT